MATDEVDEVDVIGVVRGRWRNSFVFFAGGGVVASGSMRSGTSRAVALLISDC